MIGVVVARADNGVIGRGNELPWRQSADLRHFAEITRYSTVIMGRKTYESIVARNGRPLSERRTVVVTRNPNLDVCEGVVVVTSLADGMDFVGHTWGFVIGGAGLYEEALASPRVTRVHMTRILAAPSGDVSMGDLPSPPWQLVKQSERFSADQRNQYPYRFEEYKR